PGEDRPLGARAGGSGGPDGRTRPPRRGHRLPGRPVLTAGRCHTNVSAMARYCRHNWGRAARRARPLEVDLATTVESNDKAATADAAADDKKGKKGKGKRGRKAAKRVAAAKDRTAAALDILEAAL